MIASRSLPAVLAACMFPAFAQAQTPLPTVQMAPLIDGAIRPDLISDAEAINMFFAVMETPPSPSGDQLALLKAKLGRMQLTPPDQAKVINASQSFYYAALPVRQNLAGVHQRLRTPGGPAGVPDLTSRLTLVRQIDQLANQQYAALLSSLSPGGQTKLRSHIQYLKTKMKIIPPPKM